MNKVGFVTGIKDWPYYVGGFVIVAIPSLLISGVKGGDFSDVRKVLAICILILPLVIGFILGFQSRKKLSPFNWGVFLGIVCFLRSSGAGYETSFSATVMNLLFGGMAVVAISLLALSGEFLRMFYRKRK